MTPELKNMFRVGISFLVLAIYALVWVWLSVSTWQYVATETAPTLPVSAANASLAGLLATAVATGSANVLGFKLPENDVQTYGQLSLGGRLSSALRSMFSVSVLLTAGCVCYIVVGTLVLVTYVFNQAESPGIIAGFGLAIVAWFVAAFTSVFSTTG